MSPRRFLFWLHLVAGLAAGLVIAVMAFTGLCMSWQTGMLEWADRDAARVTPPAQAVRLSLADLLGRVRDDWPDARPSSLTVYADPARAVTVGLGRDGVVYANPYTGDSAGPDSEKLRDFFQLMLRWHRWLGGEEPASRRIGATITHTACAVFLGLLVSGLVLWWPRTLSWRGFRRGLLLDSRLKGRNREWNWHNVFGLWCSPLILVITATGLLMAFRPFGDARSAPAPVVTRPEGAKPLAPDALAAIAQTTVPDWEKITLRLGGGRGRPPQNKGGRAEALRDGQKRPPQSSGPQPVVISVEERGSLSPVPRQLSVNPYTGRILADRTLGSLSLGSALQRLAKPVHTGEAGGWLGALLGAIASLGALVLIYTGFALSWRRFFGGRDRAETP